MNKRCFPRYKRLCDRIAERFIVICEWKKSPIFMMISSSVIQYLSVRWRRNNTVHANAAAIQRIIRSIPRVRNSEAASRTAQMTDMIQIKVLFFIFDILSGF